MSKIEKWSAMGSNILRGIVPVASVWGTDPTNLERCTDGDVNTVTGTGSKVMGAAGNYGIIVFDLGSIKTIMVGGLVGIWSTAGTTKAHIESSDDNITWPTEGSYANQAVTAAEVVLELHTKAVTGRYLRIRFYVSGAATAYAKIYEIMGWELQI